MNRTLIRECLMASGVRPGEMVVATEVDHPVRGPVSCPAAPMLAATLDRMGWPTRRGPVLNCADDSRAGREAEVAIASYLDRSGKPLGLAVATHRSDRAGLRAAQYAVGLWSSVLRTRRLMRAAVDPLCTGAQRVGNAVSDALARGPVYVLGAPVLGYRTAELRDRGMVQVDDPSQLPDGATVVLPAQGASLAHRAEAAARGLNVIDMTCPLVAAAQADVRAFADRGDTVVLIGARATAAAATFVGQAPEDVLIVEDTADVAGLRVVNPNRLSYQVQPGVLVERAVGAMIALRTRYPHVRGPHPDGFCYAASDRAETVRAIAGAVDVLLILGRRDCADARYLVELVSAAGAQIQLLDQVEAVRPQWIARAATIGLVRSSSAAPALAEEILAALSGLGPLSVIERRVSTSVGAVPAPLATATA